MKDLPKTLTAEPKDRVKKAIKEKNISREDLAEKVNLRISTINKICSGERRLTEENAEILARELGVRKEYLLCLDDFKTEEDVVLGAIDKAISDAQIEQQFIEKLLRSACEILPYRFEEFNNRAVDIKDNEPIFTYKFFNREDEEVIITSDRIKSWLSECTRYAAFSLNTVLKAEKKKTKSAAANNNRRIKHEMQA